MPKKPKTMNPDDQAAFEKAMTGIKRLTHNKIRLSPTRSIKRNVRRSELEREERFNLHERSDIENVGPEDHLGFNQEGLPNKLLRKLRKGQYTVEATLDLHGLSSEAARKAVDSFLQDCLHEGLRLILIIHGKGMHSPVPQLKNKLNQWLRNTPYVLAFCSALPKHGSRGALYVLLKDVGKEDWD